MIFQNVKTSSYSHENKFLGNGNFNYAIAKRLTVSGYILDLSKTYGVEGNWAAIASILSQVAQPEEIFINGKNYGIGKVISFSSGDSPNNWVRYGDFSVELEFLSEGDLSDLTGPEYAKLGGLNLNKIHLLKSFTENYTIDENAANGMEISGEHQIDIEFDRNSNDMSVIKLAQALAGILLLNTVPSDLSEYSYLSSPHTFRDIFSESYDIINGTCGFSKKFSGDRGGAGYLTERDVSIQLNNDGIVSVTDSGRISNRNNTKNSLSRLTDICNQEISGSYSRCVALLSAYSTKIGGVAPLNAKEESSSRKFDKFNDRAEYSITYSNDPVKKNGNSWSYSLSINVDERGIWSVSENGNVAGNGQVGGGAKINDAKLFFANTVKPGILGRVTSFYLDAIPNGASIRTINLLSRKDGISPYRGEVSYDYEYTDDPSIINDGDITKRETSIKINYPVLSKTNFVVPNSWTGYVVTQTGGNERGTVDVTTTLQIKAGASFNGLDYLEYCRNFASSNQGDGTDLFKSSESYSFDEINHTVESQITYEWS